MDMDNEQFSKKIILACAIVGIKFKMTQLKAVEEVTEIFSVIKYGFTAVCRRLRGPPMLGVKHEQR